MKCPECGAELSEGIKFCSNCGKKIENAAVESTKMVVKKPMKENASYVPVPEKKSVGDKIKEKLLSFWHKIDLFCKTETIAISIVTLLLVIAVCLRRLVPFIFSVLQLGGLIVALLLHKGRIKATKSWLKHLVLVLAVAFTILNFSSYSWLDETDPKEQIDEYFSNVDTPYGAIDCVGKNKDTVIKDFSLAGFSNISVDVIEDLEITEEDTYGNVESVSINGVADFAGNTAFKSASKVVIQYHSYKRVGVPISSENAKSMDVDAIFKAFETAGFAEITTAEKYDLDPDTTPLEYENRISIDGKSSFEKGSEFPVNSKIKIITHRTYEKYTLKVIVDFVPNLIFSTYDVEFEIDGNTETLSHGEDAEFEYRLKPGPYTITFKSVESNSVKGTVELDLIGETESCYKISCYSDEVRVETIYVENKGAVGENEAMVPSSASDCKYENYQAIETALRNAGFTNIKTEILYDIVWGFTDEGEVEEVSIDGKTDFKRGDVFDKDAVIIITYHMKEDDDPNKIEETTPDPTTPEAPRPVYYSTNDYETAKSGNSGVFSYKNNSGTYDVYWIIDFDAEYAYLFSEGNGEDFYDKIQITSGTLNDCVTITWDMYGEKTDWYLHFKYVNSPATLIVNDHLGIVTEFTATDLDDALALRDSKTLMVYPKTAINTWSSLTQYISGGGEYYSSNEYYLLYLGEQYSSDYETKFSRYAYYFTNSNEILLAMLINDGENWLYVAITPELDGVYEWSYHDHTDFSMNGTICGDTYDENSLLGYWHNNAQESELIDIMRKLASDMMSLLLENINDDFSEIGITAKDLGFLCY